LLIIVGGLQATDENRTAGGAWFEVGVPKESGHQRLLEACTEFGACKQAG
jgi:hypothetical protein